MNWEYERTVKRIGEFRIEVEKGSYDSSNTIGLSDKPPIVGSAKLHILSGTDMAAAEVNANYLMTCVIIDSMIANVHPKSLRSDLIARLDEIDELYSQRNIGGRAA